MTTETILYKKVKISDLELEAKKFDSDYFQSNISCVKEFERYEDSPNFVQFLKNNKSFSIQQCLDQFPLVGVTEYISLLNEVIGEKRFSYEWRSSYGYNSFNCKNAYMVDKKTKQKYYLG